MKWMRIPLLFVAMIQTVMAEGEVNVDAFVKNGVMMFADTSRGKPFAKDPAVVHFNDRYFLYYSVPPGKDIKGWRIGIAISMLVLLVFIMPVISLAK